MIKRTVIVKIKVLDERVGASVDSKGIYGVMSQDVKGVDYEKFEYFHKGRFELYTEFGEYSCKMAIKTETEILEEVKNHVENMEVTGVIIKETVEKNK